MDRKLTKKYRVEHAAAIVRANLVGTPLDPNEFKIRHNNYGTLLNTARTRRGWASVKGRAVLTAAIDSLINEIQNGKTSRTTKAAS